MHEPVLTKLPDNHPNKESGKVAVVLVNLGSPNAPTKKALRPYLKEFLSDPRVVEIPRPIWWLILNGIILNTRPKKSAEVYASIWDNERELSPLIAHTIDQADLLSDRLSARYGEDVKVAYAMRYGDPSLTKTIESLHQEGYDRQLIVPLYPQYAASTTATVVDHIGDQLKDMRHQPTLRYLPPYYDHPSYISALAQSVDTHLSGLDWTPDHLIASFHGIPKRYFEAGDPYHCHCAKTTRLLNEQLSVNGSAFTKWQMTFQSLFGKAEWLKPYTEPTLIELAQQGVKNVAVICPGFAVDCLETLEEIAIAAKEAFIEHGGENFTLVPCLNASEPSMAMLDTLVTNELQGWVQ